MAPVPIKNLDIMSESSTGPLQAAAESAVSTAADSIVHDIDVDIDKLGLDSAASALQDAVTRGAEQLTRTLTEEGEREGVEGMVAAVMAAPAADLVSEMSHDASLNTGASASAASDAAISSDATGSFGKYLKTFIPGGGADLPMPSGDTCVGDVTELASGRLDTVKDSMFDHVTDVGVETASDVASNVGIDNGADIGTGAAMAATATVTATGFMATLSSMASAGVATTARALRHAGSCVSSAYNVAEDWALRNPLYATSAGLVAATTVVGGAAWMWRNSKKKAKEAEEKQRSQMSRIADLEHSEQSLRSELARYKEALGSAQSDRPHQKTKWAPDNLFGGSGGKLSGLSTTPPPPVDGLYQPPGRPFPGDSALR